MKEKNANIKRPFSNQVEGEGQLKKHHAGGVISHTTANNEKLIDKPELQKANDNIMAEKKLFESEKRFRLLVELAPSGIAV